MSSFTWFANKSPKDIEFKNNFPLFLAYNGFSFLPKTVYKQGPPVFSNIFRLWLINFINSDNFSQGYWSTRSMFYKKQFIRNKIAN